jgi:predicted RNA-binding Zn-ribbon protein involved in translation (DUF1610 family)
MDLFSITCTTCKSRLKVRDESAIGQILACPRCGGMVMVRRPEEVSNPASPRLQDSQITATGTLEMSRPAWDRTRGDSAFDDVDELLGDAPPRHTPVPQARSDTPGGGARPRFVGAPPAAAAPLPKSSDEQAAALAAATAASLAPPPPGEADMPAPSAIAAASSPWRYWLLMAGSVAMGIVVAFAAVSAAIYFFRGNHRPLGRDASATSPLPTDAPAGKAADEAPPQAIVEVAAKGDDARLGSRGNGGDDVRPPDDVPLPADSAAADPATPSAHESTTPPSPESDPLGLVQDPRAAPTPKPANSNDPLAKFDRLIGGGDENPLPASTDIADETDREGPIPALDTAPARPTAPRPPPREVEVALRLADPLPGIETPGTPLADFLQLISDFSTIPIALEPDVLSFARVTPDSPVVVREANTTVGGALTAALRPLGLEHATVGDQIVVRLAERSPLESITHPVEDLTDGDEAQLAELAELLPSLIEPATWNRAEKAAEEGAELATWLKYDADEHALAIHHRRSVQAQVLIALEKLRSARGLPRVVRLDSPQFRLETRTSRALARLETPVSLNFQQPTRLVTIAQRLGEAADVRILFDWQGLAEEEWNPDAEGTLLADKLPLGEALDALLAPLDLAWRIVDGRTLQVVTREGLARRLELEVYKVADLVADDPEGERLLANIRAALGPAAASDAAQGVVLHFDPEGLCLLASLPQPQQRKLESLLGTYRAPP